MDESELDENRIGRKQDWTKKVGRKQVGRKQVGRKLGLPNINDMINTCGGLINIQFANDTTLYAAGGDINNLVSDVNFWLVGFDSWLRMNKLTLNIGKPFVMVISSREILLNPHIAYRGENIKIDKKIKF